jgi:hypothetical protein
MLGGRHRGFASGLLCVGVMGVILAAKVDIDMPFTARIAGSAASSARCGSAAVTTIASVDEFVARRIYTGESHGKEVRADVAHITGSHELLTALASLNKAAVHAAVHRIVYTPHWHIVRLQVVQSGRIVADVGGPDIISPISGALSYRGKTVGHFVMSVQDDLGYVKLVSRFIGIPIDLYREGTFVMGTMKPPPASASDRASVTTGERGYQAQILHATAFPTGKLTVALFIPTPTSAVTSRSCASVRRAAWGNVAEHIAARYTPLWAHYEEFRYTLEGASGGVLLVRSGSTRLVGVGPARVPSHGIVNYRKQRWAVFSWTPRAKTRIYFLTPTIR